MIVVRRFFSDSEEEEENKKDHTTRNAILAGTGIAAGTGLGGYISNNILENRQYKKAGKNRKNKLNKIEEYGKKLFKDGGNQAYLAKRDAIERAKKAANNRYIKQAEKIGKRASLINKFGLPALAIGAGYGTYSLMKKKGSKKNNENNDQ